MKLTMKNYHDGQVYYYDEVIPSIRSIFLMKISKLERIEDRLIEYCNEYQIAIIYYNDFLIRYIDFLPKGKRFKERNTWLPQYQLACDLYVEYLEYLLSYIKSYSSKSLDINIDLQKLPKIDRISQKEKLSGWYKLEDGKYCWMGKNQHLADMIIWAKEEKYIQNYSNYSIYHFISKNVLFNDKEVEWNDFKKDLYRAEGKKKPILKAKFDTHQQIYINFLLELFKDIKINNNKRGTN